jgi:GTP-binding protein Era
MKSGFVALIGRSNVGKSTLLNALVGSKVAIITPKPQTTRQAIRGIVHDPRGQIVFVDTPGVFEKSRDALTESLNREVKNAMDGIDAIVYVVDPTRAVGPEEHHTYAMVTASPTPKIMAINKSDLSDRKKPFQFEFERMGEKMDAVVNISALRGSNLAPLLDKLFEVLPEGEPFYPEFQLTDMENKKWVEELIREKVFIQMQQEVPYTITVTLDEMDKRPDGTIYIKARILTTEKRYKKMLIGTGASKIKEMGYTARKELETVLQAKVFLDLEVEVDANWVGRETHR